MLETIKLSCVYSKELEVKRVMYTINRLDWYLSNGYDLDWLSFPKNLEVKKLTSFSEKNVLGAVEAEYDQGKYDSAAKIINQLYDSYDIRLTKFVESLCLPIIMNIVVNLTLYGIGGSYSMPNRVISNISKHYGIELLSSILHEIIHLHTQFLINKYKIGQWKKETVVNLLFETAFPDIYKKNNVPPINTEKIEVIYKANFPDIEKIISLI